jgi:hypothetical protein
MITPRTALEDVADNPRFVETMPRRGYRFIATVEGYTPSQAEAQPTLKKHLAALTTKWTWLAIGATVLVLMSAFALTRFLRKSADPSSSAAEAVPAVSMPGIQIHAAISPDGRQIAFAESGQRPGIYITLVNGGKSLRLTGTNS